MFCLVLLTTCCVICYWTCPHPHSFSFQRYGHPGDFHSFPTRRSSDLRVVPDDRLLAAPGRHRRSGVGEGEADHVVADRHAGPRSEEHTSELQSLRHLVCRLLLEKKKEKRQQRGLEQSSNPSSNASTPS